MKVITIDSDGLHLESNRLYDKVLNGRYFPTCIVAIARRGVDIAEEITPRGPEEIERIVVRAARPGAPRKWQRLLMRRLLRRMPYRMRNTWRRIGTSWLLVSRRPADPYDLAPLDQESVEAIRKIPPGRGTRVLVIDDSVDSGVTLARVLRALEHLVVSGAKVRSAVINVTGRNPVARPDYCLFERAMCRFPWSDDFTS